MFMWSSGPLRECFKRVGPSCPQVLRDMHFTSLCPVCNMHMPTWAGVPASSLQAKCKVLTGGPSKKHIPTWGPIGHTWTDFRLVGAPGL